MSEVNEYKRWMTTSEYERWVEDGHIRPEIQDLIAKKTKIGFDDRGLNSYERDSLIFLFDDERLIREINFSVVHSSIEQRSPSTIYEDTLVHRLLPELLKRYRICSSFVAKNLKSESEETVACSSCNKSVPDLNWSGICSDCRRQGEQPPKKETLL